MTDDRFPLIREAVASFARREEAEAASSALVEAGFQHSDISLLAPNDAGAATASLSEDVSYIAPVTLAGLAVVSGGPIAAAIGAVVAAGLGGLAIRDVLDRFTAAAHRDATAAAVEAGGIVLWARIADPEMEAPALRLLEECGGAGVHMHARTPDTGS